MCPDLRVGRYRDSGHHSFAINVIQEVVVNGSLWHETPLLQGQILSFTALQGDYGHPPSLGASWYLGILRGGSFPRGKWPRMKPSLLMEMAAG